MNQNYAEAFRQELPAFREATDKFVREEMSVKEYKGFSGRYGSYAQRGGKAHMYRMRFTCGRITKEQLGFVVEAMERYRIDKLHFTTCQSIQLHNLPGAVVGDVMEEAISYGILSWGGGGDFPRNVMCSPLSGVEQGEYFDVRPYAEAAANYAMGIITAVKLPRKLKICFSNSPANIPHATFRDLGFVATPEGKFDVYSAGGLGANPRLGVRVAQGVEPKNVCYYIKAMVNTFTTYGNYVNRGKARTRYMQETLGTEGYVQAYQQKLAEVLASGEDLTISVEPVPVAKTGDGTTAAGKRVTPQKQAGLYAVSYHPVGGSPDPAKVAELYQTIREMEGVELRLCPDESVYIINLTGAEAQQVLAVTQDSAATALESSVACIGASICQQGVRDSQQLLQDILAAVRPCHFADGVLPKLHISGCPSSCAAHQVAAMGFRGGVKMVDRQPVVAFQLFVGGNDRQGQEVFGEDWGTLAASDIPSFLIEVGNAVSAAGTTFEAWLPEHREELKAMAAKYQD
jgi:ferredoxin-nitrite reductase